LESTSNQLFEHFGFGCASLRKLSTMRLENVT
jgi:hypothetical protein